MQSPKAKEEVRRSSSVSISFFWIISSFLLLLPSWSGGPFPFPCVEGRPSTGTSTGIDKSRQSSSDHHHQQQQQQQHHHYHFHRHHRHQEREPHLDETSESVPPLQFSPLSSSSSSSSLPAPRHHHFPEHEATNLEESKTRQRVQNRPAGKDRSHLKKKNVRVESESRLQRDESKTENGTSGPLSWIPQLFSNLYARFMSDTNRPETQQTLRRANYIQARKLDFESEFEEEQDNEVSEFHSQQPERQPLAQSQAVAVPVTEAETGKRKVEQVEIAQSHENTKETNEATELKFTSKNPHPSLSETTGQVDEMEKAEKENSFFFPSKEFQEVHSTNFKSSNFFHHPNSLPHPHPHASESESKSESEPEQVKVKEMYGKVEENFTAVGKVNVGGGGDAPVQDESQPQTHQYDIDKSRWIPIPIEITNTDTNTNDTVINNVSLEKGSSGPNADLSNANAAAAAIRNSNLELRSGISGTNSSRNVIFQSTSQKNNDNSTLPHVPSSSSFSSSSSSGSNSSFTFSTKTGQNNDSPITLTTTRNMPVSNSSVVSGSTSSSKGSSDADVETLFITANSSSSSSSSDSRTTTASDSLALQGHGHLLTLDTDQKTDVQQDKGAEPEDNKGDEERTSTSTALLAQPDSDLNSASASNSTSNSNSDSDSGSNSSGEGNSNLFSEILEKDNFSSSNTFRIPILTESTFSPATTDSSTSYYVNHQSEFIPSLWKGLPTFIIRAGLESVFGSGWGQNEDEKKNKNQSNNNIDIDIDVDVDGNLVSPDSKIKEITSSATNFWTKEVAQAQEGETMDQDNKDKKDKNGPTTKKDGNEGDDDTQEKFDDISKKKGLEKQEEEDVEEDNSGDTSISRGTLGPIPSAAVIGAGILICAYVYARNWRYVIPGKMAFTSTLRPPTIRPPAGGSVRAFGDTGDYGYDPFWYPQEQDSLALSSVTGPDFIQDFYHNRREYYENYYGDVTEPEPDADNTEAFRSLYAHPFY